MDKKLPRIKIFDPKDIKNLALKHLKIWVERFSEKGLDFEGKRFPQYSDEYVEFLKRDFKKKGKRTRHKQLPLTVGTPLKGTGGADPGKLSRRQFNLTGDTWKHMRRITNDNKSYTLGWNNPEDSAKVEGNANRRKNKRDIISNIPDSEWEMIEKYLGISIEREFREIKDVSIKVKM